MQAGHGIFRAAILILTLTVWCCFVDIAEGGTAGITVSGSTTYPDGGMRRMDAVVLTGINGSPWSGLIDPDNGFAYYGTDTSPGQVLKVSLGSGNSGPQLIEPLSLGTNLNDLRGGVIDLTNGFSYFGVNTQNPGRIAKVRLDFHYFPVIDVTDLSIGTNQPRAAVLDEVNGYAFFGTDTSPGRIVKVDTNPTRSFTEIERIILDTGAAAPIFLDTDLR